MRSSKEISMRGRNETPTIFEVLDKRKRYDAGRATF